MQVAPVLNGDEIAGFNDDGVTGDRMLEDEPALALCLHGHHDTKDENNTG